MNDKKFYATEISTKADIIIDMIFKELGVEKKTTTHNFMIDYRDKNGVDCNDDAAVLRPNNYPYEKVIQRLINDNKKAGNTVTMITEIFGGMSKKDVDENIDKMTVEDLRKYFKIVYQNESEDENE